MNMMTRLSTIQMMTNNHINIAEIIAILPKIKLQTIIQLQAIIQQATKT